MPGFEHLLILLLFILLGGLGMAAMQDGACTSAPQSAINFRCNELQNITVFHFCS